MEKLQELEINRLVTQLNYKQNDFEYRQELLNRADDQFHQTVDIILEDYPELKSIYDAKQKLINESIDKIVVKDGNDQEIKSDVEGETTNDESDASLHQNKSEENSDGKDSRYPKTKYLYREIVKITHPDKIKNSRLNDLYIIATDYYEDNNILDLILLGYRLNIPINWDTEDLNLISEKVNYYTHKLHFMESTYTWRWFSANNESEKREILLDYVRSKII